MADAAPYIEDVAKYTDSVNEEVVETLVKNLASILGNADAKYVSCTDDSELDTVRTNFIANKLGEDDAEKARAAMSAVCDRMKEDRTKSRVTFYYLVAEELGALGKIA